MVASAKPLPVLRRRSAYIGLGALIVFLGILGFWPTYFGPLLAGTVSAPFIIHFHAAVFVGWLVIFIAQVLFAAAGRMAWHFRLGNAAIYYGVFLIIVGLMTGVIRAAERAPGADAQFLINTTMDMVVFGIFFGWAVVCRRKPQIHKRAMIVAATMLLIAPASRFWFLPDLALPFGIRPFYPLWLLPMFAGVVYDVLRHRLIHAVYIAGFVAAFFRIFIPRMYGTADWWVAIADRTFAFFLG
jgi:hypothetical protein